MILADDLGYGDTSFFDGWVKAPQIDRMASEGLTVRMAPMGDVTVAQGTDDYGWAACSWTQDDLLFVVFGDDEDAVNQYTAAVIKACKAA